MIYNDEDWVKAITANDIPKVKAMLDSGWDVNVTSFKNGRVALMHAIEENFYELCHLLMEQPNINVNSTTFHLHTPLMIASYIKSYVMIDALLKRDDINLTIKSEADKNFIDYANQLLYEQQKMILEKEPSLIKDLIRTELIHPNIQLEYSHLFEAIDLNLI